MSTDILYPLLIGGGCLLLVLAVHLLTRARPSRADIAVPQREAPLASADQHTGAPVAALAAWHRTHEATVLDFFDHHDALAIDAEATEIDEDEAGDFDDDAFEEAVDAHPSPEMRAELGAARIAAESLALARERGDDDAVERHTEIYLTYRESWLERLWQFCADHERVAALRGRQRTDE